MAKLTPEAICAEHDRQCNEPNPGLRGFDYNAMALAAIEASPEVATLRQEVRLLQWALQRCPGDYHVRTLEASNQRVKTGASTHVRGELQQLRDENARLKSENARLRDLQPSPVTVVR